MEKAALLGLVADIVSAHVSHNFVGQGEVGPLIDAVHKSLAGLGPAAEDSDQPDKARPFVSVRASVRDDHLICLMCGARQTLLKSHLRTAHALTPGEYRERFDLRGDYPMTAPAYSAKRSAMAVQLGLGRRRPTEQEPPAKASSGRARGPRKAVAKAEAKGGGTSGST